MGGVLLLCVAEVSPGGRLQLLFDEHPAMDVLKSQALGVEHEHAGAVANRDDAVLLGLRVNHVPESLTRKERPEHGRLTRNRNPAEHADVLCRSQRIPESARPRITELATGEDREIRRVADHDVDARRVVFGEIFHSARHLVVGVDHEMFEPEHRPLLEDRLFVVGKRSAIPRTLPLRIDPYIRRPSHIEGVWRIPGAEMQGLHRGRSLEAGAQIPCPVHDGGEGLASA